LPRGFGHSEPADIAGCHAHIITMQRITSLSAEERNDLLKVDTLTKLLDHAFPVPAPGRLAQESLVRILPEYIGPVPVIT
jgi:hypothetical protein